MIIFLFPIILIILLYAVFVLSKDDYLLIRKNVSPETMFSFTIFASIVSLFLARLLFIIEHPNGVYLNPLVFLAFPYYPGLSGVGAIVGFLVGILLFRRSSKIPGNRIVDIFGVATPFAIAVGSVVRFLAKMIFEHSRSWEILITGGIAFLVWLILLRIFSRAKLSEGMTGIIAIAASALALIPAEVISLVINHWHPSVEGVLLVIIFIASIVLFIRRRPIFSHD